MSSTQRVKKGPGRRPLSAKRRRFMELRARGWGVRAAAREAGVSPAAGHNWANGYTVYRDGTAIKTVAPLDRLAVREISSRYLSENERIQIADLRREGVNVAKIAEQLKRSRSTIYRELKRNATSSGAYRPHEAHRQAVARRARHHRRRIDVHPELVEAISELLAQRWSPEQISRHLRRQHVNNPAMQLCHESIYQALYQPGSLLMRPSRLAPHRRSPLRTGRDHRRAHVALDRRRSRFEQPMLAIHDRPASATDRIEAGHWEGNLIIGKEGLSAVGTLVERHSRIVRLLHLPRRDGVTVRRALTERLKDLPPSLVRSITWDQGTEMARHGEVTAALGVPVYFCDSRSPWQRGSNENMNGVLRDYFPKGTDLSVHSLEHLMAVENELNHRPRRVLQDRSPATLFDALLASEPPRVLQR